MNKKINLLDNIEKVSSKKKKKKRKGYIEHVDG